DRAHVVLLIRAALATALLGLAVSCPAAAQEAKHHPVNLTFLYPIGTNQDPNVSTTFQLSVLHGRVGSLRGLGINGLVSMVERDMRGIQLTGAYSQVGGDSRGLRVTGVANHTKGDASGIHVAGIANVNRGTVGGLELGGLMNLVGGNLRGIQMTALANVVDQGAKGFQISGFANAVGGPVDGWQLASGFNYAAGGLVGLQLGGANVAPRMEGTQIGIANFAARSTGLQVGMFNRAEQQEGIPFGMVNLARNGDADWVNYASNVSGFNTGVRTSIRRFYSMLTAGLPDLKGDVRQTLVLTWNYGYAIPAGERTSIGIDLGFAHYIPEKVDDPDENDRLHYALQARALAERTLSQKMKGFVGAGVARISDDYRLDAPFTTEPLFFGGVALY
ncbi:MAG TPA: hypothetical protein VFV24_07160, partial [Candidatus Eisenbacteria bacterium]|nr:hypothetical protein [Candidatus Eisenbacteria bacterium]